MARARSLKPGFFKNEVLASLNPLARILFEGLWILADREGRLEDRPKRIKAEILPYDKCDADRLLGDLADAGFILRYEAAGEGFISIPTFVKHQNPHVREVPSAIPAPTQVVPSTGSAPTQVVPSTGSADASSPPSPFPLPLTPSLDSFPSPPSGQNPSASPPAKTAIVNGEVWSQAAALPKPEPEDFAKRLYTRHRLKTGLADVQKVIAGLRLKAGEDWSGLAEKIDLAHIAWCESPNWTEEGGRYVPPLAKWLGDEGWTGKPRSAEDRPKSKRELRLEAMEKEMENLK
jgi:hypothetical protein